MRKTILIFLCLVFVPNNVFCEQPKPLEVLLNAKSIKCYWGKGATANWADGDLEIKIEQWNPKQGDLHAIFDSIDIKNKKAKEAQKASDVSVITTSEGITFIEEMPSGNLIIVTVFSRYASGTNNKFYAVMSRHMNFPVTPFPQQYYGTAEILE